MDSNQEKALQARTAELEIELAQKTRELEIEAALERVRTVAMSMRKLDDLLDICKAMYKELQTLGFTELRNAMINILHDEQGFFLDYDFNDTAGATVTKFMYDSHPMMEYQVKITRSASDAFIEHILTGADLEEFKAFRVQNGEAPDPTLENIPALYYYFYSIGIGSVGISNFSSLTDEKCEILKRFRNLFDLAYRRYADIEQAEARAKEARIETALERVRAVAMAMKKPEEVFGVCETTYNELIALGFTNLRNTQILISKKETRTYIVFDYSIHTRTVMREAPVDSHPLIKEITDEIEKSNDALFQKQVTGDEFEVWRKWRYNLDNGKDLRLENISSLCFYFYSIGTGALGISSYDAITNDQLEILKRFKKVFELSYTRYADVAQAEAQTREAKIETALERVRSRSMGMQKSEELKEVIQIVYEQFVHLNIPVEHTGFIMDYKERDDMHIWLADKHEVPAEITIPYFDSPHWNSFVEAKQNGSDFFANHHTFEQKNKFYQGLFKLVSGVDDEAKKYYFNCPGLDISTVLLDNVGLYIENFSGTPYTAEENATLMRFGRVFQQTYTRFHDLQKAEAQAKEAQIEAALEKVRSRSLAMHQTEELREVVSVVFNKLHDLGIVMGEAAASIVIFTEGTKDLILWNAIPDQLYSKSFHIPYYDTAVITSLLDAKSKGEDFFERNYTPEEKEHFWRWAFEYSDYKNISHERKKSILEAKYFACSVAHTKNSAILVSSYQGKLLSEKEGEVLKRFARVFEQAYVRFLDIQKAEAQAKESQIELGLERVRARAMAMQNSSELADLVATVLSELKKLDFALSWCLITIVDYDAWSCRVWMANSKIDQLPESYHLPFADLPFQKAIMQAWKDRKTKWVYELKGDEKKATDEYMFTKTDYRKLPEAAQAGIKSLDPAFFSFSFSNFGGLQTGGAQPLSEANLDILSRFGKVFDGTYTRFNDLQKAEAQAREAQIQLALERVRARTMAMQRSNELSETAAVLFQQCKELGEDPIQITIGIINESEGNIEFSATDEVGNKIDRVARMSTDEPNLLKKLYAAWKEKKRSTALELSGKELMGWVSYRSELTGIPDNNDYSVSRRSVIAAFFSKGLISLSTPEPRPPEVIQLLERFADVFDGTYTRFLDLKQAEAQARESQIQLALERVRARTMAMQKSEELAIVIQSIYDQLVYLGLDVITAGFIMDYQKRADMGMWVANQGQPDAYKVNIPYYDGPIYNLFYEAIEKGIDFYPIVLNKEEKDIHYKHVFQHTSPVPNEVKEMVYSMPGYADSHVLLKDVVLFISNLTGIPYSDEENTILMRFGKVFEQTYTRFSDLKKAEEQARESQIQLALERVRARTMAMQKSEELHEVIQLVFDQFNQLNFKIDTANFMLNYQATNDFNLWIATAGARYATNIYVPYIKHPLFDHFKKAKKKTGLYADSISKEEKDSFFEHFFNYLPGINAERKTIVFDKPGFARSIAFMGNTALTLVNYQGTPFSDVENNILMRFGQAFDQTYTRFKDLEQAEAQIREAQIEAALERVRSKTMAMHNSQDVADTVITMFDELIKLGIDPAVRSGIGIIDSSKTMELWTAFSKPDGTVTLDIGHVDMTIHPLILHAYKGWEEKKSAVSYELTGEDVRSYFKVLNDAPDYNINRPLDNLPQRLYNDCFFFPEGCLFVFGGEPLSTEVAQLFKRFAGVFGLTYRRYLDLQKAEAQARQAQIEAALERVRSRTMAMQHSEELAETSVEVFKQLIGLGIEPNRLFIGIINDDSRDIELWATEEDGGKLSTRFTGNADRNLSVKKMYDGWRNQEKSITIDMQGNELKEYFHYLSEELKVPFKLGLSQKRRIQSIAYFSKGFIGMASPDEQPPETVKLLERFAGVFNLTFVRFHDLKIAEAHALQAEQDLVLLHAEKKRAEDALSELKSTQTQLIQSEKMASLGELTAGIAHEIQNPLNFVNNFSEVSVELLQELIEEAEAGNKADVIAIADDLTQNLQKINHHGKRADSIVKGMLEHSRVGIGQRQPTDLNVLADEFFKLSYHGLRAKDKTFNADLVTHFDVKLPKANVVQQDIGRVLINLFNNAFYAVNQRSKSSDAAYKPTVEVSTSAKNGQIEIRVKDNGNGMPEHVKEKIMQPFFTTKPTGEGTGLGLSLSYDIVVKGHGGSITVDTKESEFTEFIITLPL